MKWTKWKDALSTMRRVGVVTIAIRNILGSEFSVLRIATFRWMDKLDK